MHLGSFQHWIHLLRQTRWPVTPYQSRKESCWYSWCLWNRIWGLVLLETSVWVGDPDLLEAMTMATSSCVWYLLDHRARCPWFDQHLRAGWTCKFHRMWWLELCASLQYSRPLRCPFEIRHLHYQVRSWLQQKVCLFAISEHSHPILACICNRYLEHSVFWPNLCSCT